MRHWTDQGRMLCVSHQFQLLQVLEVTSPTKEDSFLYGLGSAKNLACDTFKQPASSVMASSGSIWQHWLVTFKLAVDCCCAISQFTLGCWYLSTWLYRSSGREGLSASPPSLHFAFSGYFITFLCYFILTPILAVNPVSLQFQEQRRSLDMVRCQWQYCF